MYLAKFFHRPPGDDDRELLLIPGGDPMVIGVYMDAALKTLTNGIQQRDTAILSLLGVYID